MPIYVIEGDDHRQITTDDLAKMLKIDKSILDKLKKNPVFEINPKLTRPDKLNGGVIAPAGKGSKPLIFVKVDKDGVITDSPGAIRKSIRYAISIVPDQVNPRISTYEPKRLAFYDQMDIVPNLEEALFKYCLPACKDSPIVDKRNWYYSFQNKEAKANVINEKGQAVAKALALIGNGPQNGGLSDNQILLIAKGIYAQNRNPALIPNPSAKHKTLVEIKADLVTLALKDADMFLRSCDDDVNEFYGMLLDAVDRGIFAIRKGPHSAGWYWEKGPQTGVHVVDISGGVNDFDALKSAVEANPNAYYSNITKAVTAAAGKQNIADFLKDNKGTDTDDDLKEEFFTSADETHQDFVPPVTLVMPTNYDEAIKMAIMFNDGNRPAPKVLGMFWQAIKNNEVTPENAKTTVQKLVADVL